MVQITSVGRLLYTNLRGAVHAKCRPIQRLNVLVTSCELHIGTCGEMHCHQHSCIYYHTSCISTPLCPLCTLAQSTVNVYLVIITI